MTAAPARFPSVTGADVADDQSGCARRKRTRAKSRSQIHAVAEVSTIIAYEESRRRPAARSSSGTESSAAPEDSADAAGAAVNPPIADRERAEALKAIADVRAIAQEWLGRAHRHALRPMVRPIAR